MVELHSKYPYAVNAYVTLAKSASLNRGVNRSVNEKFQDDCLNQNVFLSLYDARRTVEAWRQDYTPAATAQLIGAG